MRVFFKQSIASATASSSLRQSSFFQPLVFPKGKVAIEKEESTYHGLDYEESFKSRIMNGKPVWDPKGSTLKMTKAPLT